MRPSRGDSFPVSHPVAGDKAELAALWQTVFHDSGEYAELIFSRVYVPDNTLVIRLGGEIVSMLQMVPCEMKTGDSVVPAAYVCGVATLPSERGKGLMTGLMAAALNVMRQKGFAYSFLIPAEAWLFEVYKKSGFTQEIYRAAETYTRDGLTVGGRALTTGGLLPDGHVLSSDCLSPSSDLEFVDSSDLEFVDYSDSRGGDYFSFFDTKQRERHSAILHNSYDVETAVRDLKYDNGTVRVALDKGNPAGIAFAAPTSDNSVTIKEILYNDNRIKESLIRHILDRYNATTAEV
ncbi:MAG: GNAT family N-acetyltransferase, partial [Tannerella sp.]|nr:GNAT family N-acetyltransferase [Tannerella sp.]